MQTTSIAADDPGRLNAQVDLAASIAEQVPGAVPNEFGSAKARTIAKDAVTRTSLTSLQAVRGIAVMLVVLHHLLFYMMARLSGRRIDGSVIRQYPALVEFAFGVDLFFVLSGFLLTLIVKPYLDRRRTISNFLLHRLLRIWPLYLLVTCFMLAREYIRSDSGSLPFDFSPDRLAGLAFIPSLDQVNRVAPIYNPAWTLSYEVWLYLCFALAIKLTGNRRELWYCLSAIMLAGMVVGLNLPDVTVAAQFLSTPLVLEFIIGSGICVLLQSGYQIPFAAGKWLAVGLIWLFLFAGVNAVEGWRVLLRGVPAALVLIGVLKLEGIAAFPLWLVAVGNASYSIFLTHDLVIGRISNFALDTLVDRVPHAVLGETVVLLAFFPTVLIGWLIYQVIEKPMNLSVKKWIGS